MTKTSGDLGGEAKSIAWTGELDLAGVEELGGEARSIAGAVAVELDLTRGTDLVGEAKTIASAIVEFDLAELLSS